MGTELKNYPKKVFLRNGLEVTLRLMTLQDETALLEFFKNLPEEDLMFLKEDIADPVVIHRWAQTLDYDHVIPILAVIGERVIGDATLHRQTYGWSQHVGEIRVVTCKDFRRKGLGILLAKEIFFLALSLKLEKIIAEMMDTQTAAIEVFKAIGFEKEAILKNHVKDTHGNRHNLLIMSQDVKTLWKKMDDLIRESFADHSGDYFSS